MKNLVIYDSLYGNTEKIAQAIAASISAKTIKVNEANNADLNHVDLLVIGSPTHGGRATETLQKFLNNISEGALKNVRVAVFDTRFLEKDLNFALKILVKTIGYAAPKISCILTAKGGKLIVPPEGFIVKGKKGPLASGEPERAEKWIRL